VSATASPVQASELQELRRCVALALAEMPRAWRRALLLRYVDGIEGPDLIRAMGKGPEEVERMLDHARAYFRERLLESGLATEQHLTREGTC